MFYAFQLGLGQKCDFHIKCDLFIYVLIIIYLLIFFDGWMDGCATLAAFCFFSCIILYIKLWINTFLKLL